MKTLLVSLVAFFFVLILGCQESSITDPVSNDTELNSTGAEPVYLDKDLTSYYPGYIKLDGMLPDPSHFLNSYARIKGIVRYRIEDIKYNIDKLSSSTLPRAIKVKLFVNAQLTGESPRPIDPWIVTGSAEEVVNYTQSGLSTYVMTKTFSVKNASLNLILSFNVYGKSLKLKSMSLKVVPVSMQFADPN